MYSVVYAICLYRCVGGICQCVTWVWHNAWPIAHPQSMSVAVAPGVTTDGRKGSEPIRTMLHFISVSRTLSYCQHSAGVGVGCARQRMKETVRTAEVPVPGERHSHSGHGAKKVYMTVGCIRDALGLSDIN